MEARKTSSLTDMVLDKVLQVHSVMASIEVLALEFAAVVLAFANELLDMLWNVLVVAHCAVDHVLPVGLDFKTIT